MEMNSLISTKHTRDCLPPLTFQNELVSRRRKLNPAMIVSDRRALNSKQTNSQNELDTSKVSNGRWALARSDSEDVFCNIIINIALRTMSEPNWSKICVYHDSFQCTSKITDRILCLTCWCLQMFEAESDVLFSITWRLQFSVAPSNCRTLNKNIGELKSSRG